MRDRLDNHRARRQRRGARPGPLAVVKVNNNGTLQSHTYGKKFSGLRGIVSGLVIECCTDKRFSDVFGLRG